MNDEDLKNYRTFGFTLLQFMGLIALVSFVAVVVIAVTGLS